MDIFAALRSDHEKQRLLMKMLVETTGDSASRRDFFIDLKQQLARHAIAEHHEIDEFLAQLEQTDMDSPAWLKIMKSLQHKVLHHLAEEEREFFQQAGKNLSATEKTDLAVQYQAEMSH